MADWAGGHGQFYYVFFALFFIRSLGFGTMFCIAVGYSVQGWAGILRSRARTFPSGFRGFFFV